MIVLVLLCSAAYAQSTSPATGGVERGDLFPRCSTPKGAISILEESAESATRLDEAGADVGIDGVHRDGVRADKDLSGARLRPRQLANLDHFRGAGLLDERSFHAGELSSEDGMSNRYLAGRMRMRLEPARNERSRLARRPTGTRPGILN